MTNKEQIKELKEVIDLQSMALARMEQWIIDLANRVQTLESRPSLPLPDLPPAPQWPTYPSPGEPWAPTLEPTCPVCHAEYKNMTGYVCPRTDCPRYCGTNHNRNDL